MHKVRQAYRHKLKRRLGLSKGEAPASAPPRVTLSGRVTHVPPSEGWPALVSSYLGFDMEALEDKHRCLYMQKYVYPGSVIDGDVRLEGNVTSEDLRYAHSEDEHALDSGYVVILGDLYVDGCLEVVQEHDMFVAGSVHARALISNSANTLVRDTLTIEELVWLETSEEGGWLWAPVWQTPLMVRWVDQEGPDYRPDVPGRVVEAYAGQDTESEALSRIVEALSSSKERTVFRHVAKLAADSQLSELAEKIALHIG